MKGSRLPLRTTAFDDQSMFDKNRLSCFFPDSRESACRPTAFCRDPRTRQRPARAIDSLHSSLHYLSAGNVTSTTRAHLPLRAVLCPDHLTQARVGCPGLRRASRASRMRRRGAGARPQTITSEPRGIAGSA
ncbi:MAG: hypothetical protein PHS80_00775 [Methanothrix sp.]|nr:hypothetical protein [Methanothrix sp.]MDD4447386.1 hypothetical protein [Methanothrix sp.]